MKNPTTVERASERELVVTRTFNGPVHIVFEAWTRPELLMRWWLPASFGMSFVSCEADVRTGGMYRFVFNHPSLEQPMAFFGRYLEVVPDSRIVWTNEESADGCTTTVTLEEKEGRTHLVLRELYPSRQALDEAIASGTTGTGAAGEQFELLDELLVIKGFVKVNEVELYYEIHGTGSPLIMLHGGVTPSEMFAAPLAEMAREYKVIALHARGHGFSTDSSQPWTRELFADDVAAVMDHLGISKASVMGYSSGALTALQTAIRYPNLVDRLVVISAAFRTDGYFPEVLNAFAQMPSAAPMIAAGVSQSPLASLYPAVNWETMFRKTGELANEAYDWSGPVAGIKAQSLIIFADADAFRLEHIMEFYKLLGGGQREAGLDGTLRSPNRLAIIPNTTHYTLLGSAALTRFVSEFLEAH